LMTTRLEDIARFAAFGASGLKVVELIIYQIPYVLPIVIPISAIIASLTVSQRLSTSGELIALRASGLSLAQIFSPVLILAFFLSLTNFLITSELATESAAQSRSIQKQVAMINPLAVIHNKQLIKNSNLFIETASRNIARSSLEDVTIAFWNEKLNRMSLFLIREMLFEAPFLEAKQMTAISSFSPNQRKTFDNLYLENIQKSRMDIEGFSLYLDQKARKVNHDYLKMALLLTRMSEMKKELEGLPEEAKERHEIQKQYREALSEIFRRLSLGAVVFAFTLMGLSFGCTVGRNSSQYGILAIISLACLYLILFFTGKSLAYNPFLSVLLYFAPIFIIVYLSLRHLSRLSGGLE